MVESLTLEMKQGELGTRRRGPRSDGAGVCGLIRG